MESVRWKRVGAYHISNQVLGEGSFSRVMLGRGTQGQVAVKVIDRKLISGEQCFESQVKALRHCRHESVVRLLDIEKSEKNFYMFLEHCEGGNLAESLRNRGRLPESQALELFQQIARGIEAMQALSIIHRDLKPSNIMIQRGRAKIVDFGLARQYSKGQMLQSFAGTKEHMAPEIIEGKLYSQKVDVYSAGILLYEMLYGVRPFKGNDYISLLKEISKGVCFDSPQVEVSQQIKSLLKNMLQLDPESRMDMPSVLQFLREFSAKKRVIKLEKYGCCKFNRLMFMPIGSLLASFSLPEEKCATPCNMDLRLYSKLCSRMNEKILLIN